MSLLPPRPESAADLRLDGSLVVTSDEAYLDYDIGARVGLNREGLEHLLAGLGIEMQNGIVDFAVLSEGIGITDPDELYTPEQLEVIFDQDTQLGKLVKGHLQNLYKAYDGQPTTESLEAIARAAIHSGMLVWSWDPTVDAFQVPTLTQLAAMPIKSGCASCDFTSFANLLSGKEPDLRPDVITVSGVNVRAFLRDEMPTVVVGYLDHENPFEVLFHDDLSARLQPLLTEELAKEVVRDSLVGAEVERRCKARLSTAVMELSELDKFDISNLADTREADLREQARLRREEESRPSGGSLGDFLGQLLGGRVQVMTIGPDGLVPLDPESFAG